MNIGLIATKIFHIILIGKIGDWTYQSRGSQVGARYYIHAEGAHHIMHSMRDLMTLWRKLTYENLYLQHIYISDTSSDWEFYRITLCSFASANPFIKVGSTYRLIPSWACAFSSISLFCTFTCRICGRCLFVQYLTNKWFYDRPVLPTTSLPPPEPPRGNI